MGLDNGIYVKRKDGMEFSIPFVDCPKDSNSFDLCYWRKYWGVRSKIIRELNLPTNGGTHAIDVEGIPVILRILEYFIDKDVWEDEGESIWDYEEGNMKHQLICDIVMLSKYMDWVKNNPNKEDYQLFFYDSF